MSQSPPEVSLQWHGHIEGGGEGCNERGNTQQKMQTRVFTE